jgi:hypothetical protein
MPVSFLVWSFTIPASLSGSVFLALVQELRGLGSLYVEMSQAETSFWFKDA